MTSGPLDKVTMRFAASLPGSVRSALHPAVSRFVEAWSPVRWARNQRADAFFLWFPKTGGTWARLLLHRSLCQHFGISTDGALELEPLHDADARIPRIRPFHDDAPHWKRPEQLRTHKRRYRGRKVMLLVRDPRDAIVSLHLQVTKRWKVDPETPLRDFIWGERGSLKTLVRFYNIWAQHRDVPAALLLVRYEDVHADTEGWLRKMLDFLGVNDVSDEVIREAIAYNDIAQLRKREAEGVYQTRRLRPGDPSDPDSFKARRGKVGGFVDYLSREDIERMTEYLAREMDPWYGYPTPIAH